MRMPVRLLICVALINLQAVTVVSAATIAAWTFESDPTLTTPSTSPGSFSPEVGAGTATALHADSATPWTKPAGNGSSISLSATRWSVGDYWQFQVDTTGYSDLVLDWDQASSAAGPRDFALQYSTDGTNFTQFGSTITVITNTNPPGNWSSGTFRPEYHYTVDMSSVSDINNAAAVYFRLAVDSTTSSNGGTISTSGASRIDSFMITGVPEPSACISCFAGLVVLAVWRSTRKATRARIAP